MVAVEEAPGVAEIPEITGGFSTFTVVEADAVLPEVSVESAQRVVEPFVVEVVFHETEYSVPLGVEVEPKRVLDARVAPKLPHRRRRFRPRHCPSTRR